MPPLLWLIIAFLVGVLIEWALEIFFFRRRMFAQAETERLAHEKILTDWRAKYDSLQTTLDARIKELNAARASVDKLQADLDVCAGVRANLEKENTNLIARTNQLTGELDETLKSKTAFESDLQTRDAQLAKLHLELSGHQTQNASLAANVAKFSAGAVTATATIKALEGDKTELEKQLADLKSQLGKANAELSASVNAKASVDKQLADLKAQLDKANAELSISANARAQLDANLKARETELAKLHTDLDARLSQNKNFAADVAKFTAGAATATAPIKVLEDDKTGLETQIGQLKGDLSACASARAKLEADLKARNAEIEKLRTQATLAPVAVSSVPTEVAILRNRREDDETPFEAACPQHLSDVKGIGTVFETRLYEAGIGSYWELAQLSNSDLARILQLTDLQSGRTDLDAIRADARRLAKETKSLGRKWSQGKPDDFEPLEGIGHTFEKRLYDAGICTYHALANASVELLDEICHAPAQFKPDYAAWIRKAQELVAKQTQTNGA